jgi:hypothetical protein
MEQGEDFYIGYTERAPESIRKFIKRIIIGLSISIPLIAMILVIGQQGFSTGTFEFGHLTELEGILHKTPYPGLTIISGKDINGNFTYQDILLVGYGKFGASGILDEIEMRVGVKLEDVVLKLNGTLIYNDGKTLFELTRQADSYVSHSTEIQDYDLWVNHPIEKYGTVELKGEIIDPKCYFGVMKPGEGKPHRSCAIRCISGGIPPMLAARNELGESNYYILMGPDYEPINDQILPFVADQVITNGTLSGCGDWLILQVEPAVGIRRML